MTEAVAPMDTEYQIDWTDAMARRLVRAIFTLAIRDAMSKNPSYSRRAREWLVTSDAGEMAEILGIKTGWLREWIEQGCPRPVQK